MASVEKNTEVKTVTMGSLLRDNDLKQYGSFNVLLPSDDSKGAVFNVSSGSDGISVVNREKDAYGRSVKDSSVEKSPADFASALLSNFQKDQVQLGKMLGLEAKQALFSPRTTFDGKETSYETNNLAGSLTLKDASGKDYRVSIIKHQSKEFRDSRDTFTEQAMAENAYGKGAKLHTEKVQGVSFEISLQEKGPDGNYTKENQKRLTVYAEQDRDGNLIQHSDKDRNGNLTQSAFTFKDGKDPKTMEAIATLGKLVKDNYGYDPRNEEKNYETETPSMNFRVMNHADLSREIATKALEVTEGTNRNNVLESGRSAMVSSRLDGQSSVIVPALAGKNQAGFSFENRVARLGSENGKIDLAAYGSKLQEINSKLPKKEGAEVSEKAVETTKNKGKGRSNLDR